MRLSNPPFAWCSLLAVLGLAFPVAGQGQQAAAFLQRLENATDAQLQAVLKRFPAADSNKDGQLTRDEATAFLQKKGLGEGQSAPARPTKGTPPTAIDIEYGPHQRNKLDFWQAAGDGAKPLVIFIHGGGFVNGDKSKFQGDKNLEQLLKSGVSCAAINYPFREHAPIQGILRDAARAVQFLRSKSDAWNLDKTRFAAWGGSAGAGTSLWLGSRDDLADAASEDPVLRESSRVQAVVLTATQATYNLPRWREFIGEGNPSWWRSENEVAQFYHLETKADLETAIAAPMLKECDMLGWINAGDAQVFVSNSQPDTPPQERGHYIHHPAHAREIEKHCRAAGVPCYWQQSSEKPEVTDPLAFVLAALHVADGSGE